MKRKAFALLLMFFVQSVADGHDFWMQPTRFRFQPGETIAVAFSVGENFIRQPWKFVRSKIQHLQWTHRGAKLDLRDRLIEGDGENLRIENAPEGTHLISLQSSPSSVTMDRAAFDQFLTEEGLDEIVSSRKKNPPGEDSITERYTRHSKLLLQAGSATDDTFSKELGFPVEIIPLENPYSLKIGNRIHFKILYNGKPLFGARVKILNRYKNRTTIQNIYTQKDGIIETTLSNNGNWLIACIKMTASKDADTDYESIWATLVFGT
jgi:uncharacterized GH25 family protein